MYARALSMHMSKTLPSFTNFYMAGQGVESGGSRTVVVMSGRQVMQIICQHDKKNFVTSTP